MELFKGISANNKIAYGNILVMAKQLDKPIYIQVDDVYSELRRLDAAIGRVKIYLNELCDNMHGSVQAGTDIFEAHKLLLMDEAFIDQIHETVRAERVSAGYAVWFVSEEIIKSFRNSHDELLAARAADVKDVAERLIYELGEKTSSDLAGRISENQEPFILVAEDILPSELVRIDSKKLMAIATSQGTLNSHAAILANMMNIPAIVNAGFNVFEYFDGDKAIINGKTSEVIFNPDEKTVKAVCSEIAEILAAEEKEKESLRRKLKGKETITISGKKIKLLANTISVDECADAFSEDAEGIGLFRSEFLFIGRDSAPTEEEQLDIYVQASKAIGGRPVIVRTLDIGADKTAPYIDFGLEENPALGYRGIRVSLKETDIFKEQLRALLRASFECDIRIMYPMIASVWEVKRIAEIISECRDELIREGVSIGNPKQGIMIETPAAVMMSSELAQLVDFFSIGTNDLTQYALAADRQNSQIREYFDSHHEAVFRMIDMVVRNAHEAGITVGMCGELAGDASIVGKLVEMGIDELSVPVPRILEIRELIRGLD